MLRILITAIALYLLFLACYLLWERSVKRRQNAARKKSSALFRPSPKEDIIGKSTFRLRHSQPEATMLVINEKANDNPPIFAPGNAEGEPQGIPAVVPPSELDRVFSPAAADGDENEIVIDYRPEPEDEPDEGDDDGIDEAESEDAGVPSGAGVAQGLGFDDLSGMLRTVDNTGTATPEEKEEAGRTLVEIRKTDMFEQVVSGEAKKKVIVSQLMDDYFAAYHHRHLEARPEPAVKAPDDFDIRSFA